MKRTLSSALVVLLLGTFSLSAQINFDQATISQVVNEVLVVDRSSLEKEPAQENMRFAAPDILETGRRSRAQMTAPDGTVFRVGSNTVFSFEESTRTMNLGRGTLLFNSPSGRGGGRVVTASASASVLGSVVGVASTEDGGFKVIAIENECIVEYNDGTRITLRPGQVNFVLPRQVTTAAIDGRTVLVPEGKPGPVVNIDLGKMVENSQLVNGFSEPLPSDELVQQEITEQQEEIESGALEETGVVLVGTASDGANLQVIDGSLISITTETREEEEAVEMMDDSGNNEPDTKTNDEFFAEATQTSITADGETMSFPEENTFTDDRPEDNFVDTSFDPFFAAATEEQFFQYYGIIAETITFDTPEVQIPVANNEDIPIIHEQFVSPGEEYTTPGFDPLDTPGFDPLDTIEIGDSEFIDYYIFGATDSINFQENLTVNVLDPDIVDVAFAAPVFNFGESVDSIFVVFNPQGGEQETSAGELRFVADNLSLNGITLDVQGVEFKDFAFETLGMLELNSVTLPGEGGGQVEIEAEGGLTATDFTVSTFDLEIVNTASASFVNSLIEVGLGGLLVEVFGAFSADNTQFLGPIFSLNSGATADFLNGGFNDPETPGDSFSLSTFGNVNFTEFDVFASSSFVVSAGSGIVKFVDQIVETGVANISGSAVEYVGATLLANSTGTNVFNGNVSMENSSIDAAGSTVFNNGVSLVNSSIMSDATVQISGNSSFAGGTVNANFLGFTNGELAVTDMSEVITGGVSISATDFTLENATFTSTGAINISSDVTSTNSTISGNGLFINGSGMFSNGMIESGDVSVTGNAASFIDMMVIADTGGLNTVTTNDTTIDGSTVLANSFSANAGVPAGELEEGVTGNIAIRNSQFGGETELSAFVSASTGSTFFGEGTSISSGSFTTSSEGPTTFNNASLDVGTFVSASERNTTFDNAMVSTNSFSAVATGSGTIQITNSTIDAAEGTVNINSAGNSPTQVTESTITANRVEIVTAGNFEAARSVINTPETSEGRTFFVNANNGTALFDRTEVRDAEVRGQTISITDGGNVSLVRSDLFAASTIVSGGDNSVATIRDVTFNPRTNGEAATTRIEAGTLDIIDTTFSGNVELRSEMGMLARNPNTGAESQPGFVNFINNVFHRDANGATVEAQQRVLNSQIQGGMGGTDNPAEAAINIEPLN